MPKLYSVKRHEKELSVLQEEYAGRLKELQAAMTELKEENRRLSAEVSVARAQKQAVSDAMIAASEKREAMKNEFDEFVAVQKALVVQAAEKAQSLLDEILKEYPDRDKDDRFREFQSRLHEILGAGERLPGFSEAASAVADEAEYNFSEDAFFEEKETFCNAAGKESGEAADATEKEKTSDGAAADGRSWKLKDVLEVLGLTEQETDKR